MCVYVTCHCTGLELSDCVGETHSMSKLVKVSTFVQVSTVTVLLDSNPLNCTFNIENMDETNKL